MPELDKLKAALDRVESRTGKSASQILGFGDVKPNKKIESLPYQNGRRFGDFEKSLVHGRSVSVMKNGGFYLGHYNKGLVCPGPFIEIYALGHFNVGEIYLGFFKIKLK